MKSRPNLASVTKIQFHVSSGLNQWNDDLLRRWLLNFSSNSIRLQPNNTRASRAYQLIYGVLALRHHGSSGKYELISVLMYDCCEHTVIFGGLCQTVWPSPRIEFHQPAFGHLQPPEYRVFLRSWCVRQATPNQTSSLTQADRYFMMEIARSARPKELVWQELSPVEWRFVESKN